MKRTVTMTLVAAAFALPAVAIAGGQDKSANAAGKPPAHSSPAFSPQSETSTNGATSASADAKSMNKANDGGASAMFQSMDKDNDGFITKVEATGTPHFAQFAQLDKNGDGKLSAEEHFMAPEHVAAREGSSSGASASDTTTASKKTY